MILTSKYPFTVNGKPATYTYVDGRNITYFYEFVASKPETLEINFLPKPLPNTPFGYITLDGSPPPPTNITHTNSHSAITVKPTTTSTNSDDNVVQLILLAFFVIFILIISVFLLVSRK